MIFSEFAYIMFITRVSHNKGNQVREQCIQVPGPIHTEIFKDLRL